MANYNDDDIPINWSRVLICSLSVFAHTHGQTKTIPASLSIADTQVVGLIIKQNADTSCGILIIDKTTAKPEWSHNVVQFIKTFNVDQYNIDMETFACRRRRLAAEGIIFLVSPCVV